MMYEQIDRPRRKQEAAELLRTAQVSPKAMTALYLSLVVVLNLISSLGGSGFFSIFISILTTLLSTVLAAGFALYCMAIRRGERAEYLTLFDGFSFVGKLILLDLVTGFFVFLWSLLFVIPGIVAIYRYQFAKYNLYENPGIGVMEALDMSKRQTRGYKLQLFMLDLSYFGWTLLATFPALLLNFIINRDLAMSLYLGGTMPDITSYGGIPLIVWNVGLGLWQLVVSLFCLANYICVELSYFETAKSTSGAGKDVQSQSSWDGWNPPDGLC